MAELGPRRTTTVTTVTEPPAKIDWNLLDLVLKNSLAPLYELLCHNEVETSEAVDEFVSILSERLRNSTSINTATSTVKNSSYHRPRAIDKTRVNLTKEKNLQGSHLRKTLVDFFN